MNPAALQAAAATPKRRTTSSISGIVSATGSPNWPPGSPTFTADGALGCGLTFFMVWRPAWLIWAQKWLPLRVAAPAHFASAACISASGSDSITTFPGRSSTRQSVIIVTPSGVGPDRPAS